MWARAFQGALRRRITDSSGAILALARITIIEEATSVSSSTITNGDGEYCFPAIKPSTYTLVVEAPGFKKFEQRGIVVSTQSSVTQDVTIGEVTETVNVSAESSPLLETSEASTGQVLDRQKLEDLQNLGRNPFSLSRLSDSVKLGMDWRALHSDSITSQGPSSFGFKSGFTSQTPTKTVSGTGGGLATMLVGATPPAAALHLARTFTTTSIIGRCSYRTISAFRPS
jgi:hypothetical protein